jgi:Fic family protein
MNILDIQALHGLDADIRVALLQQLRDLWTHGSAAIEGNTLTLGETKFVIEEGLTVSGKPLKDHEEVVGHARAIELLAAYELAVGQLGPGSDPMPDPVHETAFLDFCRASYRATRALLAAARGRQMARHDEPGV